MTNSSTTTSSQPNSSFLQPRDGWPTLVPVQHHTNNTNLQQQQQQQQASSSATLTGQSTGADGRSNSVFSSLSLDSDIAVNTSLQQHPIPAFHAAYVNGFNDLFQSHPMNPVTVVPSVQQLQDHPSRLPPSQAPIIPSTTQSTPAPQLTVLPANHAGRRWSCERCRARKMKCDGVRPICGFCSNRGFSDCVFLGRKHRVDAALASKNLQEKVSKNDPNNQQQQQQQQQQHRRQNSTSSNQTSSETPQLFQSLHQPVSQSRNIAANATLSQSINGNVSSASMAPVSSFWNSQTLGIPAQNQSNTDSPAPSVEQSPLHPIMEKFDQISLGVPGFDVLIFGEPTRRPTVSHIKRQEAPMDEERSLIEMFFANDTLPCSIIHKRTFLKDLNKAHPLLRLAICAAAFANQTPDQKAKGKWYYEQARGLVWDALETPTIEALQGIILLGVASDGFGNLSDAWQKFSMACRMVMLMKLDEDPDYHHYPEAEKWNWIDREVRRRVWWVVKTLDQFVSIFFHQTKCLNGVTGNVKPICDERLWKSMKDPLTLQFPMASPISGHYVHYMKSLGDAFDLLLPLWIASMDPNHKPPPQQPRETSPPTLLSLQQPQPLSPEVKERAETFEILMKFESWRDSLPQEFQVVLNEDWVFDIMNGGEVDYWPQILSMYLMYHGSVCCLLRKQFTRYLRRVQSTDFMAELNTLAGHIDPIPNGPSPGVFNMPQQLQTPNTSFPPTPQLPNAHVMPATLVDVVAFKKALISAESIAALISLIVRGNGIISRLPELCNTFIFHGVSALLVVAGALNQDLTLLSRIQPAAYTTAMKEYQNGMAYKEQLMKWLHVISKFFEVVCSLWPLSRPLSQAFKKLCAESLGIVEYFQSSPVAEKASLDAGIHQPIPGNPSSNACRDNSQSSGSAQSLSPATNFRSVHISTTTQASMSGISSPGNEAAELSLTPQPVPLQSCGPGSAGLPTSPSAPSVTSTSSSKKKLEDEFLEETLAGDAEALKIARRFKVTELYFTGVLDTVLEGRSGVSASTVAGSVAGDFGGGIGVRGESSSEGTLKLNAKPQSECSSVEKMFGEIVDL